MTDVQGVFAVDAGCGLMLHSYLVVSVAAMNGVILNVGYYMANA
jgi:hypothetical protein